jgi:hypothetical protein
MHAIHPDPLRLLLAAAAALVLMLAALAMPPVAGELSLGSGGDEAASPAPVTAPLQGEPRWVRDPLSPPRL